MPKRLAIHVAVYLFLAGASGAAPQYRVVLLDPPGWWVSSLGLGVSSGQQVGSGAGWAVLWRGSAGSYVVLNPSGCSVSWAYGVSDGQQVGYGYVISASRYHALLWSGSAASCIDLHPAGYLSSEAYAVSAGLQVGRGSLLYPPSVGTHALLWSGSAQSCVDLHPNGWRGSEARGISDGQQVGVGVNWTIVDGQQTNIVRHALLWSGSAGSCIDLHPDGYGSSEGFGISAGQQVGCGDGHALLWSGTPQSCVDLNPAGFADSQARGLNAGQQVGYGTEYGMTRPHAILWSGTSESWLDLHAFLPSEYDGSLARGIDSDGNIVGYALCGNVPHAVIWVPLPDVVVPTVSTSPAMDVTKQSATLNGFVTSDGGEACQYRFRYKDDKSDYVYTAWTSSVKTGEPFRQPITNLKPNGTYYFNSQAKNSAGESEWGNEQTFVTGPANGPTASFKSLNVVEKGYPKERTTEAKHMVGGLIRFDPAGSRGTIVKYEWDFGNNERVSTSAPNTYEVTYQKAELYTVKLTVTDDRGVPDTCVEELDLRLKPGDLIFLRSAWWDIPFIGQTYTHVGMYVGQDNMVESLAVGNARSGWVAGVVMTRLSDWSYPSETYAIAKRVEVADDATRQRAVDFALSKMRQGYDFNVWQKSVNDPDYYCSELVWAAYFSASDHKISLGKRYLDLGGVWPDDIANDDTNTRLIGLHQEHRP